MPQLNAVLSTEAMEGWRRISARHGVSITALTESVGLIWRAMTDEEMDNPTPLTLAVIADARRIDHERRRRR